MRIWISNKLQSDADADHTLRTTGLELGKGMPISGQKKQTGNCQSLELDAPGRSGL